MQELLHGNDSCEPVRIWLSVLAVGGSGSAPQSCRSGVLGEDISTLRTLQYEATRPDETSRPSALDSAVKEHHEFVQKGAPNSYRIYSLIHRPISNSCPSHCTTATFDNYAMASTQHFYSRTRAQGLRPHECKCPIPCTTAWPGPRLQPPLGAAMRSAFAFSLHRDGAVQLSQHAHTWGRFGVSDTGTLPPTNEPQLHGNYTAIEEGCIAECQSWNWLYFRRGSRH